MVERSREIFEKNGILGEVDTKNGENIKLYEIFLHYTNISIQQEVYQKM